MLSIDTHKKFQKHEIDISKATNFYLFSDGYPDQFGGEKGRKYMLGRFKDTLTKLQDISSMSEQGIALEKELVGWMNNNYNQIDDILVIGCRVGDST